MARAFEMFATTGKAMADQTACDDKLMSPIADELYKIKYLI